MLDEKPEAIIISNETKLKVEEAIKVLQKELKPYLQTLTSKERCHILKANRKNIGFVEKTLHYAEKNIKSVPPYLDFAKLKSSYETTQYLALFYKPLAELVLDICNSKMISGSEAYNLSLTYYNSTKVAAASNVESAKPIYDDLKQRFAKK